MNNTLTKQQPKLSVRKPGHWRNKWRTPAGGSRRGELTGRLYGPNEVYFGVTEYISAEMAEQAYLRACPTVATWLGPVFFPEEGDGQ